MRRPKGAQHVTKGPSQARGDVQPKKYNVENLTPFEPGHHPKGAIKGKPIKRYSPVETEAQLAIVEQALIVGLTEREIYNALRKREHFVGIGRVRILKARVHEQMKLESERTRPMSREKQLRRLYAELAEARGTKDNKGAWIVKPMWSAVTRIEQIIAQVEGNFEAIKLDVDVVHREALTNVLTSITPEQANAMLESYDKLATLAQQAAHATGQRMPSLLPAIAAEAPTFVQARDA